MPPSIRDRALAAALAQRIVATGSGRVQRVAMIGSRALGTAHPSSDLDLVVLVEIPSGARPSGASERMRERNRIQEAVGLPPISTDLSVRTTDDYYEARGVVGGVEHLVDFEGVDLYARPISRPPAVRRSPEHVRRIHAGTWITHAVELLVEATAPRTADAPQPDARYSRASSPQSAMNAAAERAVTSLLVTHQIHSAKRDGVHAMLSQLQIVDSATAATLRVLLDGSGEPLANARAILRTVVHRLKQDRFMVPHLRRAETWLSQRA